MPQSFGALHFHLVFSTKNREPMIDADLQPRHYEYMGGILRAEKSVLLAAGGMSDHVHLLVSLSRELSIAETVRLVKANSSKWIHQTFPERAAFAWQAGYGAFSVSLSNLPDVKTYLARQAEHHRVCSFQEPAQFDRDLDGTGGWDRLRQEVRQITSVDVFHRDVEIVAVSPGVMYLRDALADPREVRLKLRAPFFSLQDLL